MTKPPRIGRDHAELVEALRQHTSLLAEYYAKAFDDGDDRYLGEVAGKLRVLVHEAGRNSPLLLRLMNETGIESSITIGGPPQFEVAPGVHGGDEVPVREWLGLLAFYVTADDGQGLELSKREVIAIWAQQSGAAHEDWEHDEVFVRLRRSGVLVGGLPPDRRILHGIASCVLGVAREVLHRIDSADPG